MLGNANDSAPELPVPGLPNVPKLSFLDQIKLKGKSKESSTEAVLTPLTLPPPAPMMSFLDQIKLRKKE